jgi:predicted nucleic acid-binding Zn ribbon protein
MAFSGLSLGHRSKIKPMKKQCEQCGEAFTGRVDKRFCSDYCRTTYNNRVNRDVANFVRNVNSILRRNRRVLEELNPEGKTRVHREKLLERGFKFSYFTNEYVTKSGKVYRFCYDQGYVETDQGYLTLVVRQEYVE